MTASENVVRLEDLRIADIPRVGGKNASLGEMIGNLAARGIRVPGGFATTAAAYRGFLAGNGLAARIEARLAALDPDDVEALARCGAEIRQWVVEAPLPGRLEAEIAGAYRELMQAGEHPVAVRSSATAEDLPDASFAGQQETLLNVTGLPNVLAAIRHVFASLYNDRAISYRVHKGFAHAEVALSAGIQLMVRSDLAASGVLFTLDTESGFRDVVFITASYGLGETVVQGAVNPDEIYVHKPMLAAGKRPIIRRSLGSKLVKMIFAADAVGGTATTTVDVPAADRNRFCITDEDALELARFAVEIERHYGRPMDIEWGKDGLDGKLYILQARPETVKSQAHREVQEHYRLKERSRVLVTGRAIGQKIGTGPVRIVADASAMSRVQAGDVLVTDMTDPNWEPVMKRAAAIVTNRGGRTCHAAIIARELGIPAVVGCGDATRKLADGADVTVSCAEGDTGNVYEGTARGRDHGPAGRRDAEHPGKDQHERRQSAARLRPAGLAQCRGGARPPRVRDQQHDRRASEGGARVSGPARGSAPRSRVGARGYPSPRAFYVEKLAEGVGTIAAAFWPKPVIVRLSDFKSNEYRKLIGGARYEPEEENPMLGFRGASRYVAESFRDCFALECEAMKRVREDMGLTNVELMIPFVRTVGEARAVMALLARQGLRRGENGLRVVMMCELPSNALLADQFLEHFDGFSIGSNDLTQLTLGLDRDSGLVAEAFDERDPAVRVLLRMAIQACRRQGKYVGICGQGPSDHPDLARWLMEEGIESLSLNPDTVVDTWLALAKAA